MANRSQFVENYFRGVQQAEQEFESQRKHENDAEDRKLAREHLKQQIRLSELNEKLMARRIATENFNFLEGAPADEISVPKAPLMPSGIPQDLNGGQRSSPELIQPAGTRAIEMPLPMQTIPGIEELAIPSVQRRPNSLQELLRQRAAEKQTDVMGRPPVVIPRGGVLASPVSGETIAKGQPFESPVPALVQELRIFRPDFDGLDDKGKLAALSAYINVKAKNERNIDPLSEEGLAAYRRKAQIDAQFGRPDKPTVFEQRLKLLLENPDAYHAMFNRPEAPTTLADILGMSKDALGQLDWDLAEEIRQTVRPDLPPIRKPGAEQTSPQGSVEDPTKALQNRFSIGQAILGADGQQWQITGFDQDGAPIGIPIAKPKGRP